MSNKYFTRLLLLPFALLCGTLALQAQQFRAEIQANLREIKPQWNLTDRDIADWSISDQYTNRKTGVTYTYLQQQIDGIPIFNAISAMAIRDARVVHFANRFHADAAGKANGSNPKLSAENAIRVAAAHLGITAVPALILQQHDERGHRWVFEHGSLARKNIQVELYYVPVKNTFRLAWNVILAPVQTGDWWNIRIDAQDGRFLEKNNWTVYCNFDGPHQHHAGSGSKEKNTPGKTTAQQDDNIPGMYNVFAFPVESPSHRGRSLLTDPHSPAASPFGWHDTDGAAGAEYTITRGNNVYAYEDRADQDQPGYSPDGGPTLSFDFPIDFTQAPDKNQDAHITNLFYVNNAVHDILHEHGFDETAGNFQDNNYGHGGLGADYVQAEAQDGGGTNNANFSTPPDGNNGAMQMYLWSSSVAALLKVNAPAGIAGNYTAIEATFGPGLTSPITSNVVLVDDGTAPVTDGCSALVNGQALSGKIAVLDRGTCSFAAKIANAQAAGAIAAIVCNNSTNAPIAMSGGGGNITIPSVMISQADGNKIKDQLNAGQTVNVTLSSGGGANVDLDGSLDNGIVAHEYCHGLSTRLTGGPGNSNCLSNGEQGGEGWSDWLGLILTIEPGDAGTNARGIGTYALGEPVTAGGIRRYPYSTDMSINPQTYADLALSPEVHDIGEIWSQVLWDMTWKLIDAEGFDPDWYNGTGGNNTALNLVIEGMKLQPCSPGFLDARDAILKADEILYNHAHRCLIWAAFARRGMGRDALQGSSGVAGDETAGFGLPNICQTATQPPIAKFSVDATTSCAGLFNFTDQSTSIPQFYSWDFGDGTFSEDENPQHTFTAPGTYAVILTVTNNIGSDSDTLSVTYTPIPTPLVTGNTTVCAGGTTMLTAAVSAGNTANWMENGTVLFTGNTFQTPNLVNNTTYSVQQIEDKPVQHVGPANNGFGSGGNHNTGFEGRLLFEAYAPFRLLSVFVYAQGAGDRTITLYDNLDNIVQSVTVNVPNGASRVKLNLDIPVAGLYSLANTSENLYRNNGGASYPYTINNLVQIYKSNATTNELTFYYYFYDWEVQEKYCASQPVDVAVSVTPGPIAGFTAVSDKLVATFTNNSTGNPSSFSWKFGDGATSSLQNPVHTYAAPGTYTVELTVSDGNCSSVFTQTITVMTSGVNQAADPFGLHIYPNPAADEAVNIDFQQVPAGPIQLKLCDAAGRLCFINTYEFPGNRILLNTVGLAAGVYQVQISGKTGMTTRKITLMR